MREIGGTPPFPLSLLLGGRFDFFDAGRFAAEFADVIQLRAADASFADDFHLVDDFRMEREDAFHAVTEGDLADREGRAGAAVFLGDADTFEDLDAFLVAFLDLDVDFDGVARFEGREFEAPCMLRRWTSSALAQSQHRVVS